MNYLGYSDLIDLFQNVLCWFAGLLLQSLAGSPRNHHVKPLLEINPQIEHFRSSQFLKIQFRYLFTMNISNYNCYTGLFKMFIIIKII